MEIEIPAWLYELLLIKVAQTDSAVEEIAEFVLRKFMERKDDNVEQ
ncbi:MAG: hypothetical protein K2J79_10150 [Ruminiclostridium sp.]|nr:hypothetical protein [Ruminiclostridium sp.]